MWSLCVRIKWNVYQPFVRIVAKSHFLVKSSLQKLQMLIPVHNDANNADDANNTDNVDGADDYNRVICITLLKSFSCAKKEGLAIHLLFSN